MEDEIKKKIKNIKKIENSNRILAINLYGEIINSNPEDCAAYIRRADLFMKGKKYVEAIEDLKKIIAIKPESPIAIWLIAYAYEQIEDNINAVKSYDLYLSLRPSDAVAYEAIMELNLKMGELEKAMLAYNEIIEICNEFNKIKESAELSISKYNKDIELNNK